MSRDIKKVYDETIEGKREIILFGAGKVCDSFYSLLKGGISWIDIKKISQIADQIKFIVDNDESKWQEKDPVYGLKITSPDGIDKDSAIIIITCGAIIDITKQLLDMGVDFSRIYSYLEWQDLLESIRVQKEKDYLERNTNRINLNSFEHALAMVVIVKNESPYICEWIEHHMNVGASKIYLYDNESEDDIATKIKPFVEKGIVEYFWFPGRLMQVKVYNSAVWNFRDKCKYMAIIDADEFLMPCDTSKTVVEVVDDIMSLVPSAGGVAVNWRTYGSSGHIEKPNGGLLENYLHRAKDNHPMNRHIKTIVNPRCVSLFPNPHYPNYFAGKYSIDEKGLRVDGPFNNSDYMLEKIRINHYFTKSKQEWIKRRSLVDVATGETRSKDFAHNYNDIYDDIGLFYAGLIRHRTEIGSRL